MSGWTWTEGYRCFQYARGSQKAKARIWKPHLRIGHDTEKWTAAVRDGKKWDTKEFESYWEAYAWAEATAAASVAKR